MADVDHLDGNAVAGLLSELFTVDMTGAACTCAHCGAERVLGELHAYMHAPGTVLRCPACGGVIMRLARVRERVTVDTAGISRISLSEAED